MTVVIALAGLVRDGRVLLVHRRASRAAYPDCWDLAGGHVESGETPLDAVRRECREELGVVVHDAAPVPVTTPDPALEVHAFLVTRWDGEPFNAAPDEHDDLRWFAPGDLDAVRLAHPAGPAQVLAAAGRALPEAMPGAVVLDGTAQRTHGWAQPPAGAPEPLPTPPPRRTIRS